jgi:hypothetical protein
MPHNRLKRLVGCHIRYFNGLGLMGWSFKYLIKPKYFIGGLFKCGSKKWTCTQSMGATCLTWELIQLISHWVGFVPMLDSVLLNESGLNSVVWVC